MENENAKEIKRVLECCNKITEDCEKCPFNKKEDCLASLVKQVVYYIDELENENKMLIYEREGTRIAVNMYRKYVDRTKNEINQLNNHIVELENELKQKRR